MGKHISRVGKMISIIIPACNEEKYIEKTLASIKNSKFTDYELIVAANGCTDNTSKIANKYARVFELREKGISLARNTGARAAKGEVLVFLDADSTVSRGLLKAISKESKKYAAGICRTWPIGNRTKDKLFWSITNFISSINKCPNGLTFIRKDLFKKIKGFDEKVNIGEDTQLLHKAKKYGRIKIIKDEYIKTSMRRFEKQGYFKTILKWIKAYFIPDKKEYEIIR